MSVLAGPRSSVKIYYGIHSLLFYKKQHEFVPGEAFYLGVMR
jgi:hypothetical protein